VLNTGIRGIQRSELHSVFVVLSKIFLLMIYCVSTGRIISKRKRNLGTWLWSRAESIKSNGRKYDISTDSLDCS
jgi:hypothetical protein